MNEEFNPYKILNVTENALEEHKENLEEYLNKRKEQLEKIGVDKASLENAYDILIDKHKRKEIIYDTALGLGDKIQEYEVSKVKTGLYVVNKKKVYSNIDMQKLVETEIDEKGENVIKDPEYRNDVLRHLLSKERIKSCVEYNHGYLGEVVEKDYEDRLDPYTIKINREHYSAVMKYYGERSYEPRHAIKEGKEGKEENKINDTKKELEDDELDR